MDPSSILLAFQQAPADPGLLARIAPLLLIFVIFYFLLIAPARKRQKAQQQMIDNLKKGDKVVTSGGIHGEIASVDDRVAILKVADNVRLKVLKSAVASLVEPPEKRS